MLKESSLEVDQEKIRILLFPSFTRPRHGRGNICMTMSRCLSIAFILQRGHPDSKITGLQSWYNVTESGALGKCFLDGSFVGGKDKVERKVVDSMNIDVRETQLQAGYP